MNPKLTFSSLLIALVSLIGAAYGQGGCDPDSLAKVLDSAKILGAGYHYSVKMENDIVKVSTTMMGEVDDKDYKINTILIAKRVMDYCGDKGITKVRVYYRDPLKPMFYISALVRSGDIKAFGSKLTSRDELLSSIDLVKKLEPRMKPLVVQTKSDIGLAVNMLNRRVDALAARNVDVNSLKSISQKISMMQLWNSPFNEMCDQIVNLQQKLGEVELAHPAPRNSPRPYYPGLIIRKAP